jgi:hypothetical protein
MEMTNAIEKINIDTIETRIYSYSRTNLLIMINITRNQRAGLIPHLLNSRLILSFLISISWVNRFPTRNKSEHLIVGIMIFLLYYQFRPDPTWWRRTSPKSAFRILFFTAPSWAPRTPWRKRVLDGVTYRYRHTVLVAMKFQPQSHTFYEKGG